MGGDPPTGGHSGPVFAANPRAMQGFTGPFLGGSRNDPPIEKRVPDDARDACLAAPYDAPDARALIGTHDALSFVATLSFLCVRS